MHPSAGASTSKPRESSKPKDKWANYTSAKDLGIEGLDTSESSYEVEQQLKGRAAKEIGAWETVVETSQPQVYYTQDEVLGGKRKLGEYNVNDEAAEGEDFKFAHKDKRPVRDPYDDDDWDPKAALGQIKLKSKVKKDESSERASGVKQELQTEKGVAMDRSKWTGRLEINASTSPTKRSADLQDVDNQDPDAVPSEPAEAEETKPVVEDVKPNVEESSADQTPPVTASSDAPFEETKPEVTPVAQAASASSMFKKRRPPPKKK